MARSRKVRKGRPDPTMWDEVAESIPRTDTPTGRKAAVRRAMARVWILTSIVLTPILLVAIFFAVGNMLAMQSQEQGPAVSTQQLQSSPGQGEALIAVEQWLESGPEGGRVVSWESAQTVPGLSGEGVTAYAHTFSVATADMGVVRVSQVVLVDDGTRAVSAADFSPSIDTTYEQQVVPGVDGWAGYEQANLTGVDSAVTSWARAWSSGDPENVRVVVRDPNSKHAYPTISGVASVQTRVVAVSQWSSGDENPPEGVEGSAVARVDVQVTWEETDGGPTEDEDAPEPSDGEGTPEPSDGGGDQAPADGGEAPMGGADLPADGGDGQFDSDDDNSTTFTFDLRLTEATSGTPTVTAWGPAGTGPSLVDHQNAFISEDS